ncbi:MAG: FAD-dependent oxidoreductase [Elusimicrobia bacterium]|nr:FAD-dependent oxidoreductase [Elusimicrobiota bacterium]
MDLSRRSFIRWVIASGAAMACPIPGMGEGPAKAGDGIPPGALNSENFSVGHEVRDGVELPSPPPDQSVDVVIVGGGPSGLAAADELKSADFLLLEKEEHVGGNSRADSWEGCAYSTAAAWDSTPIPEFEALAKRFKFDWKKIQGEDSACFEGKWIRNFWTGRADNPAFDQLPYSKSVKDGFRQFLSDIEHMDFEKNVDELDAQPFSQYLKGRPAELKAFWDGFGPSNWGAPTELTSAYVGLSAARDWFRFPHYTWEGGIGVASRHILEALPESARRRVRTQAYVYSVKRANGKVRVSYFHDGKPRAVEAKSVVMATPKFITKMLVDKLPADQYEAMSNMRYAPYLVYNLCFDRVVYNQGYDNWPVGAKNFTDFIPADWVTHAEGGDMSRKQVITVYAPRPEMDRRVILKDENTLAMAHAAAGELVGLFPGWLDHLQEVRINRRGHPMPMSVPGYYTKIQPLARRDLAPIYFGHSDAMGEVSDFLYAAWSGITAAQKAAKHI